MGSQGGLTIRSLSLSVQWNRGPLRVRGPLESCSAWCLALRIVVFCSQRQGWVGAGTRIFVAAIPTPCQGWIRHRAVPEVGVVV